MLSKLHYVNIGKDGRFSGDGQISSTPEDIDWMFGKLTELRPERLLLVLHGGLVDEARALGGIDRIHDRLVQQGIHPVYIVWETGIFDIIRDIAEEAGARGWFRKAMEYLLRVLGERFGGGVGLSASNAFSAEAVREQLHSASPFDAARIAVPLAATAANLEPELESRLRQFVTEDMNRGETSILDLPPELRARMLKYGPQTAAAGLEWTWLIKPLAAIAIRCVRRFLSQRDHGLHLTISEEVLRELYVARFGGRVWTEMKERAAEMWRSNVNVARPDLHAGRYFLSSLEVYLRSHPGATVDVVGHSAGSIATCEMLEAIARDGLRIRPRHLFLLAPACTTMLFQDTIAAPKNAGRYETVRVFTMNDAAERADRMIPFVYPASLLYAISGLLEEEVDAPLLGLHRHISGRPPYDSGPVAGFLTEAGRLTLSPTPADAADGARCGSTTHAGFADDIEMIQSIVHHTTAPTAAPIVASNE